MRLSEKLILYALAVALIPLAATGFTLLSLSEGALRERVEIHQTAAAAALSSRLSASLEDVSERLITVLSLVDLSELTVAEREGVSILLYRQSPMIAVATLVDSTGASLAPDRYLSGDAPIPAELGGHPLATADDAKRLKASLPNAREPGRSLSSEPYFPGDGTARLALAIPTRMEEEVVIAAVELVLVESLLDARGIDTGEQSETYLVDARGRALIHPSIDAGANMTARGPVEAFLQTGTAGAVRYSFDGSAQLAAYSPLDGIGGAVVVTQPESIAFAAVASMRQRILIWIAATLAVVLLTGFVFAERLRRRLGALTHGARAFGRRELDHAIDMKTKDELGELATTMTSMAGDLALTLGELEEWNQTLEDKVAQRTAELEQTQAQLVTQAKMAAIGQLGAGVAHEINNPLAGVLGFAQLLLRGLPEDDPKRSGLEQIEAAAQRCREITAKLLRYSERSQSSAETRFSVKRIIEETVDLTQDAMRTSDVRVELDLAEDTGEVFGVPGEMSVALINLMTNARTAMPKGGALKVRSESNDDRVRIEVTDSGSGIDEADLPRIFDPFFTRKEEWRGLGLGLSLVYRIINDMGGKVEVASTGPDGTTIRLELPTAHQKSRVSA